MKTRSFLSILMLLALIFGLTGVTPARAAGPTRAQWLNADGSLNLNNGYSGNLDISNYHVSIDPVRGPVFRPMSIGNAWNALGSGVQANVHAIAVSGTTVYVGGAFTNAGGNANADYIAKWNGTSWVALGTTPLNGLVYSIAINGANVYVGGGFTNVGGNANADYIAKWNGTSWSALGATPLNMTVKAIAISSTGVYVGGYFSNAGGKLNADYIAKWNGSAWSALGATPLNSLVEAIAISGANVYVGGGFTDVAGNANADYIAKWNGTSWVALGATPLNDPVQAIAVTGTDVYVGGFFTNASGNANADYIAKWNGVNWSALGATPLASFVEAITISGTAVYVGGNFTNAGGNVNADYIAKWNGISWVALGATPLNNRLENSVDAIALSGTNLYAGGFFSDAGGNANADNIARFSLPVAISLPSVPVQDGWVLESGENTTIGSILNNTATTFSLGDSAAKRQYRGVLSFNTGASIPDTATIIGAILKVKQQGILGTGNPISILQGFMIDIKNGFFASANTLQISDFQAVASITLGPANPAPVGGVYSFNILTGKAFINKLATNGGLTQIRLRFKLDDNNDALANVLNLYSGNAVNAADRPQLVITYALP